MAAASVAAVCLGGTAAFTLGGDAPRSGYVAVGAAGGPATEPGRNAAPRGKVELVPLDPPGASGSARDADGAGGSASGDGASGSGGDASGGGPGTGSAGGDGSGGGDGDAATPGSGSPAGGGSGSGTGSDGGAGTGAGTGTGSGPGTGNGTGTPKTPDPDPSGEQPPSEGPALLKLVGDPELDDTDRRWCQDVTLTLLNSGGSAVRSGTVTFETHIIGALGIDWATVENTEKLPVPIEAGERKKKTWKVCVDSWRVPLGMHLETRDVTVKAD